MFSLHCIAGLNSRASRGERRHGLGRKGIGRKICTNAGGFAAVLAVLYGMLYAIIRSEDYALLMGSSLLSALALVMVLTRKLDWYSVGERVRAGAISEDA